MAEPLKNIYNRSFFDKFLTRLQAVDPSVFLEKIYDDAWEQRELKQRIRHITQVLGDLLPKDYPEAIKILLEYVLQIRDKNRIEMNFVHMFLPDFVEIYGLNDFETSVSAMTEMTQFTSCEFAVRPFLIKYGERMMQQMYVWSQHEHPMVRRLASEGSRPRLPWAMAVPSLKQNPLPILPVLERLKNDESESVRRSIANNLNDIAKDHPHIAMQTMENWRGLSSEIDWIIRHGSRTLLKRANADALKNFGFETAAPIEISDLVIDKTVLTIGEILAFGFSVKNLSDTEGYKMRLEFGIDYMKASGKTSRKIFQISETILEPCKTNLYNRKLSFGDLTTRKHYTGGHRLAIIVNGQEKVSISFHLTT